MVRCIVREPKCELGKGRVCSVIDRVLEAEARMVCGNVAAVRLATPYVQFEYNTE